MDILIYPNKLSGKISSIPSKSQAHRLLICAAFSANETQILCTETNRDIEATAQCLCALGASISYVNGIYHVTPVSKLPEKAVLPCGESGSTLRFMVPIAGALGVDADFLMEGRLPNRPLSPLREEMERMGCSFHRPSENVLRCIGQLRPGKYSIDGGVSSQFISGLLLALPLLNGESSLEITGKIESAPYIHLTRNVLKLFGISVDPTIRGCRPFRSPGTVTVEGDWSNAAFFLAANILGSNVQVTGLNDHSTQGDKAILPCLDALTDMPEISAADIPDLVPILAVAAGAKKGARFTDIARLRLKESDRVETVAQMLRNLGAHATYTKNTLEILPGTYHGCIIDAAGDHRIAMAGAIAATVADGPVTILGAECTAKSYPGFWNTYKQLGGHYEQHIR